MLSSRTLGALLASALAAALSGCIAAAIPLVAGAALATTQSGRGKPKPVASPVAPPLTPPTAQVSARSDFTVVRTSLTALPPPSRAPGVGDPETAAFASYAAQQADIRVGGGPRPSALLVDASGLRPERADCGALRPAVYVDLDPGRGTFDPLAPGRADPELAAALDALRGRGVTVVWFSRLGENFAAATRAALADGGLDPTGGDVLVLMRDIGERKQTRRDQAAQGLCPIAILGDERADFDELYLYLKQAETALVLDTLIGRGWFLASPFVVDARSDKDATP